MFSKNSIHLVLAVFVVGLLLTICEARPLSIWAAYQGTYDPNVESPPLGLSRWLRGNSTLPIQANTDNGHPVEGIASFNDDSPKARIQISVILGGAFGLNPSEVEYEFRFKAKFYPDKANMADRVPSEAVSLVGFRDEDGVNKFGKSVLLGFFIHGDGLSVDVRPSLGFADENAKMIRSVGQWNFLDGQFHNYAVQKYIQGARTLVRVLVDDKILIENLDYTLLPDATRNRDGFGYFTSTPGAINASVASLEFGTRPVGAAASQLIDLRNIQTGQLLLNRGYADQPYVVVNEDKSLTCILTTGGYEEGASGQHLVVVRSRDLGKTWSEPVAIERLGSPENSWGVPIKAKSGRIYVLYTMNSTNMRSVLDFRGQPFHRVDTVGELVFRYSDDNGETWSYDRFSVPMRVTDMDRSNIYRGDVNGDGKIDDNDPRFFWTPSAAFSDGANVYVGVSKIGDFDPTNTFKNTEGWVYCSPNLLIEPDPSKIIWEMRPEGAVGLRSRYSPVSEETTVVKIDNGTLVALCRTIEGIILVFYSKTEGRSWSSPEPLTYAFDRRPLRNPRAKPCIWPLEKGKYLIWFENIGSKGYENRNPAWVTVAEEHNGRLVCSQPEILLFDRNQNVRISYPDFFQIDGRYFITETQKSEARVHEISAGLIEGLVEQSNAAKLPQDGLIGKWSGKKDGSFKLDSIPDIIGSGLTLEFWVKFDRAAEQNYLFEATRGGKAGITVSSNQKRSVVLSLSNGATTIEAQSDPDGLLPGQWNHIVCILDPGPRIAMFVINGRLSDGGKDKEAGWTRYSEDFAAVADTATVLVGKSFRGEINAVRVYNRALTVSEAIASYRFGKNHEPNRK